MEVTNLDLSKREFDILATKLNHIFKSDALTTLTANYQSSRVHQGYILPVYTDTDEPYWLFYYPGSADAIEALSAEDKIWGYLLDKTDNALTYDMLKNVKTFIIGLNMICSQEKELGSLRYKSSISETRITIPSSFDKSILECLAEQGFLYNYSMLLFSDTHHIHGVSKVNLPKFVIYGRLAVTCLSCIGPNFYCIKEEGHKCIV